MAERKRWKPAGKPASAEPSPSPEAKRDAPRGSGWKKIDGGKSTSALYKGSKKD